MGQAVFTQASSRSTRSSWRVAALLFGSVTFVLSVSVAVHELGHLVMDRVYGLEADLVLEPFRSSYTVLAQPWPADMSAWPVVAGPLANVIVGALLFVALWGMRNPYLMPLLLWGPIALVQESTTALVQMTTREAGTDWVLLVEAGLATGIIVGFAIVGLLAGLGGLFALLPVSGLSPIEKLWTRLGVLGVGMGGFTMLALVMSLVLGYASEEVARNLRLTGFVLVLATLLAVFYPATARLRGSDVMEVSVGAARTAVSLGAFVIVLFLVIYTIDRLDRFHITAGGHPRQPKHHAAWAARPTQVAGRFADTNLYRTRGTRWYEQVGGRT